MLNCKWKDRRETPAHSKESTEKVMVKYAITSLKNFLHFPNVGKIMQKRRKFSCHIHVLEACFLHMQEEYT